MDKALLLLSSRQDIYGTIICGVKAMEALAFKHLCQVEVWLRIQYA